MKYNKLIRDKIPEIIKKSGKTPITHVASSEEYNQKLTEKLQEEVAEFISSGNPEELADILEVIYSLAESKSLNKESLENMRRTKAEKRGSFKDKIILDED